MSTLFTIGDYIKHRMQEMGYLKFHVKPFGIVSNNEAEYYIKAYNEFFYLLSKNLESGTSITSDTNILIVDDHYFDFEMRNLQEFTGLIHIRIPNTSAKQILEFIRVIPE